jgi:hypothetical protein
MLCMVFGAQPTHIKRARVVIVVCLHVGTAADLARLAKQCALADGLGNANVSARLIYIPLAPCVFAFGLGWRLFAGCTAGALFNALTLTLLCNPRRVLHLPLVVQTSVDFGAYLAFVEGALAAPWMSIELVKRFALAAFETGLHLLCSLVKKV